MRMLTFYINRAGHNLDATQRAELEKAKALLHRRIQRERETGNKTARRKKAA